MSLAMFAAPIENNDDEEDMINQKKRQTHNRTQKKYSAYEPKLSQSQTSASTSSNSSYLNNSAKVNSVLASIQENMTSMDDSGLADFKPIPPPESIGAMRTKATEENKREPMSYQNGSSPERNNPIIDRFKTLGKPQMSYNQDGNLDLNYIDSNYVNESSINDYYNKFLPAMSTMKGNGNSMNQRHYKSSGPTMSTDMGNNQDVLLQKINYMINLLEDQQDERTGNVGEEVVLYSFLGVFMIFLVDSFVKVGKYVR